MVFRSSLPILALWAIFAVIVLAAVMSTTDRLMLTIGAMCSWDLYKKIIRPNASDKSVVLLSKVIVVLSAFGTMILAINPPAALASLIWMGIGIMLATFAVPFLAGLYWRGATRAGALASMFLGLVSAVVFGALNYFNITLFGYNYGNLPLHFSFYPLVISVVAMYVVSIFSQKTSEKVLDETQTGWYISKR